MSFFNPLDVITGGVKALPGTGVSQAAINAGKVNAPAAVGKGSLGALDGGKFGGDPSRRPMPNPTDDSGKYPPLGPPESRTPPAGYHYGIDWDSNRLFPDDPNNPNTPPMNDKSIFFPPSTPQPNPYPYKPIPGTDWGGRVIQPGDLQPAPQPWPQNTPQPVPGMPPQEPTGILGDMLPIPAGVPPLNQPMGNLQSLSGGQLNQSGMVNLRGPDGSMKAVPQSDLSHWLSKGAVRA